MVVGAAGARLQPASAAAAPVLVPGASKRPTGPYSGALDFAPHNGSTDDVLHLAAGYRDDVLIRWGDAVLDGAPDFDPLNQTAAAQAQQFGYNCDYLALMPLSAPSHGRSALLVVNHESTTERLMFRGYNASTPTTEQRRVAQIAHGISVVRVDRRNDGGWELSKNRSLNRRITLDTEMEMTGPAVGSPYLTRTDGRPSSVAFGTLNDCAGGTTPWGTTLHGEENFDGYFGASGPLPESSAPATHYSRYDVVPPEKAGEKRTSGRRWEEVEVDGLRRFDLAVEPNEFHRFGWIVEVDPYDPQSVPRKRTALGRMMHEGATVRIADDGRVVAYMGDDARNEYIYKFVSRRRFRPGASAGARAHNMTLLDDGDLFVARFEGNSDDFTANTLPADEQYDGVGTWVPLVKDGRSAVAGRDVAWVLLFTRLAADLVGPTKMDRPEDVETNPVTGRVYAAPTKNPVNGDETLGRGFSVPADEANPITESRVASGGGTAKRGGNNNGYVMEWEDSEVGTGTSFRWRLFMVAGIAGAPETYFAGFPSSAVSSISCPDNIAFDPAGNLWLSTDGNVVGSNDGVFAVSVEGPERGHVKRFLTVPVGAEATGPVITSDARSLLVSVQHPGAVRGATFDKPTSTWPDRGWPTRSSPKAFFARPSVVCVVHADGGYIGE